MKEFILILEKTMYLAAAVFLFLGYIGLGERAIADACIAVVASGWLIRFVSFGLRRIKTSYKALDSFQLSFIGDLIFISFFAVTSTLMGWITLQVFIDLLWSIIDLYF